MRVSDLAQMLNSDPNYVKRFFGLKTEETPADTVDAPTPAKAPAPMPNWGIIPSKSPPRMSDQEYEDAYRELARKDVSEGGGRYKDQMRQLRREYISAASPDRKSWFQNGVPSIVGEKGSPTKPRMHFNPSGMWFYEQTPAEKARENKLQDIYFEEAEKYEAVHGKPTGTGQVDRRI